MKVLQLGKHYPFSFGGIEKFYYDLAEELVENNITCDIFCANETKNNKIFDLGKIKVISYGRFAFKASTSLSFKIFPLLKRYIDDYDILHVHLPDPMITLALYFLNPKKPIVIHWHSDIVKQKYLKAMFQPFQTWLLKKSSLIIATSPNYIESSMDLKPFKNKCISIPSGFNPSRLSVDDNLLEDLRNKYKHKKIIYSFGRMTEYKGFEYLIESAKYLSDEYLIIIAGGGDSAKYKQLASKLGVSNKIEFLGRIDDSEVGAYYELCDLFVLSSISRNEAFGLVQCEAMYFSKPIVSTNIEGSGVSYVNLHNKTGLIVEIKNPIELAKAYKKIIDNKEMYNEFSKNSKERFNRLFHIKSISKEIIKKYKELLNDNKN